MERETGISRLEYAKKFLGKEVRLRRTSLPKNFLAYSYEIAWDRITMPDGERSTRTAVRPW